MLLRTVLVLLLISVVQRSNAQVAVMNLKDFGAVPNDGKSDHEAFKKAAAVINKRKMNVKLVIEAGKYIVGPKAQYDARGALTRFDALDDVMNLTGCSNIFIEGKGKVTIVFADKIPIGIVTKNKVPVKAYDIGSLFRLTRCKNISISNIQANGNLPRLKYFENWGLGTNAYERDHDGLFIMNSQKITVKNSSFNGFVRDGCMILGDTNQLKVADLSFFNCSFDYNGRNGVSWTAGDNVRFYKCNFRNMSNGPVTTNPGAGLDIEPERGATCSRGAFIQCEFSGNRGYAVTSGLPATSDVLFDSCKIIGTHSYALYAVSPRMVFKNTLIAGSSLLYYTAEKAEDGLQFYNCDFTDSLKGHRLFTLTYVAGIIGRYERFYDCTFTGYKVPAVFAEISRKNPADDRENCLFERCTFSALYHSPSSYNQHGFLLYNCNFNSCTFKSTDYTDFNYILNEQFRKNRQQNSRFIKIKKQ